MTSSQHLYEVRPRKDHPRVELTFDALPFGRLWWRASHMQLAMHSVMNFAVAHVMP